MSAEVRVLKATGSSKSANGSGDALSAIPAAEADRKIIRRGYRNHGKRFSALSELWVKKSALGKPYPERLRLLGPWHPERIANNAAWEEGIVAELYFYLPTSCHEQIEHSTVFSTLVCGQSLSQLASHLTISKFMQGAKAFRSSLIDDVREKAAEIFSIPSITEARYFHAHYDRSQTPAIIDLLKDPSKPEEQFAVYPRVLFANYEVVNSELFKSPALVKVSHPLPILAVT